MGEHRTEDERVLCQEVPVILDLQWDFCESEVSGYCTCTVCIQLKIFGGATGLEHRHSNKALHVGLYVLLRERAPSHSCPRLGPSVESKVVLVTASVGIMIMMVLTMVEYVGSES